jgi:type VI secretion system secreted protein Hcp
MAGFIKFEGIDGESRDKDHDTWSDIIAFNQGMEAPGELGGYRRSAKLRVDNLKIIKLVDKATCPLMEGIFTNKTFPTVEIHITRSYTNQSRKTYLAIKLRNVIVTAYNLHGVSQSDEVPREEISLAFTEIDVSYFAAGPDGNPEGNYNVSHMIETGQ